MVEYEAPASDGWLAQVAAERHPEAYAAELPESWAGHDVEMVLLPHGLYSLDEAVDTGRRQY